MTVQNIGLVYQMVGSAMEDLEEPREERVYWCSSTGSFQEDCREA